jgi:hypothetical protein
MNRHLSRISNHGSIGGRAFLYVTQRARWYLTGISSLRELLAVLRTAPAIGWPVRPRARGTSGFRTRKPRIGG